MNTKDIIAQALTLAERVSPACAPALKQLKQRAENESLKIAVLGHFKAGKSTLINTLFLNSSLLPTEYSECTAIPVRIMNGTPELRFGQRDADGRENILESLQQPTADTIQAAVTAETDEARMALAQQYSFAELSLPNILPDGICLVDTPGLDSPNAALMLHTMWEAHDADAVIYLVRGKTLAASEVKLIAELSGSRARKIPFFVVLTTDDSQAPATLQLICEQICAQLHTYGIPVETGMLSLHEAYHDRQRPKGWDKWTDMLAQAETMLPESMRGISKAGHSALDALARHFNMGGGSAPQQELRARLLSFLTDKVSPGREAKLCRDLLPLLTDMQNAISLRMQLSQEKQEEREAEKRRIAQRHEEYRRTVDCLLNDIAAAQAHFYEQMQQGLVRIKNELADDVNQQERAGDILTRIKSWEIRLPQMVHHEMAVEILHLETDLRKLRDRYQIELEQQMIVDGSLSATYEAGFLSSVPTWVLTVTDYLIFDVVSPLPFFMDMGLRFLLGKIGLGSYMPEMLAAKLARRMATDKLEEAMRSTESELRRQLEERFRHMNDNLRRELVDNSPFNKVKEDLASPVSDSDAMTEEWKQASLRIDEWKLILD